MNTGKMFTPTTAKLCARKKDNKVFSLYLSNGSKVVADRTFKKVKGKTVLEVRATNSDEKGEVLSAFIYKDDADWNKFLSWCVDEGLLDQDEAQAEMN